MRRCLVVLLLVLLGVAGCKRASGQYEDGDDGNFGSAVAPCAPLHRCAVDGGVWFDRMGVFQVGQREEIEQTTCPGFAPHERTVLYGDLGDTSYTCGTCGCGPAACALPTDMEVSTAKCSDSGAVTPWGAPDGWEGTCSGMDAPANGGGSLTIEAPPILPCAPIKGPHVDPTPAEPALMARECLVTLERSTCGEGELCVPELPPDDPLSLCLVRRGEDHPSIECPADYPRRFVMFTHYVDHRGCTPCECGASQGAACSALINIYTDAACGDFLGALPLSAPIAGCIDLPAGVSMGSKDGLLTTDVPGTCAPSGGTPSGEIELNDPVTLCCEAVYGPAR